LAIVATLLVGGLVAFQPPANALLSREVGDLGVAFVSLIISTALVALLLLVAGEFGDLSSPRQKFGPA
jgi:uncharacterized membrane protein YdcZ (DUF606 family)